MKFILRQVISFLLPLLVIVLVPRWIEPHLFVTPGAGSVIGVMVILCGLSLLFYTVFQFITIGKGTLAPWFPTASLVVTGPYRYVRNPMILGVLITLVGESILFRSEKIAIWMLVFFCISHLFFLVYEEPSLIQRFGDAYLDYQNKVPRWIPHFPQRLKK